MSTTVSLPLPAAKGAREPRHSARIPSLDGLRALSIALVMVNHALSGAHGSGLGRVVGLTLGNGPLGVDVFFVISGYLITRLLVDETHATGGISLRGFYYRRVLRIFPAFYTFLAAALALRALGRIQFSNGEAVRAAFFVRNYSAGGANWWLGHIWSLSVEEQFYLIWPATLAALGTRRARSFVAGVIVLEPLIRVANYLLVPSTRGIIPVMMHTRADTLAFGCLLALAWDDPRLPRLLATATRWKLHWLAAIYLAVEGVLGAKLRGSFVLTAGYTLEGASVALLLAWAVREPQTAFGRLLNARPIVHIGKLSYSLYLWQQLFLSGEAAPPLLPLPAGILAVLAMAELSYNGIEKPFLRLRDRLAAARAPADAPRAAAPGVAPTER